jgi:hypothetical protein
METSPTSRDGARTTPAAGGWDRCPLPSSLPHWWRPEEHLQPVDGITAPPLAVVAPSVEHLVAGDAAHGDQPAHPLFPWRPTSSPRGRGCRPCATTAGRVRGRAAPSAAALASGRPWRGRAATGSARGAHPVTAAKSIYEDEQGGEGKKRRGGGRGAMSVRIKAVVDRFVKELQEALDADIQDHIMKEREMQSYIEERESEVVEREAAWKAELSRREVITAGPQLFFHSPVLELKQSVRAAPACVLYLSLMSWPMLPIVDTFLFLQSMLVVRYRHTTLEVM